MDDEEISLKALSEYLEEADMPFDIAHDGQAAVDKLVACPNLYGAIVLDWIMPNMSGMDVLKKIKNLNTLKHIPVIMLTCVSESADILSALKAGIFEYLTKPVDKKILIQLIEQAKKENHL